jgi:hypothetical protein
LEQRLLVLEREVAFLKSQGLSRAEVDGVLTSPHKGLGLGRRWLQWWMVVLSALVLVVCFRVFVPSVVQHESDKTHKKMVLQPEPSGTFALPSADN